MSDLICGERFWTQMTEVPTQYMWLDKDINCDVLVVGGGITGALTAYRFAKSGIDTVLISKSPIGYMGTSISLGVLDYSIGDYWENLKNTLGKQNALKYYNMCLESLLNLEELINNLNYNVDFNKVDSILYSKNKNNIDKLNTEHLYRKNNGFDVEYIEKSKSRDIYSFNLEGGIRTKNTSSNLNPYLFVHGLLKMAVESGARVYENTSAHKITYGNNILTLNTSTRKKINSKRIIMATGYDKENYLNIYKNNKVLFTAITKPLDNFIGYENEDIIYNIDNNFTVVRSIGYNRIMISGTDNKIIGIDNKLSKYVKYIDVLNKKSDEFENKLNSMFCGITDISIEYKTASVLPQTKDNLPVIGENEKYPNIYFNYVSGYNGIVQAEMASRLLLSLYNGSVDKDIYMFYPDRKTL